MDGSPTPTVASCRLCGRPTYDPGKGDLPWARGVVDGRQVLVCPACQIERPDWTDGLDACKQCGSTRLSVALGEVICRQCGAVAGWVEESIL